MYKYFPQLLLSAFTLAIQMKSMNQMNNNGYIVDIIINIKNASDAITQLQSSSDSKYADDLSQALANLQEIQHDFVYFVGTQHKDNLNNYYDLLEDTESILNKVKTQLNCTEIESINHLDGILKKIQCSLIEINNYQNEISNIDDDEDCEEKVKIFNTLVDLLIEAKNVLTQAQVELINEIKNSNDDMTYQISSKDEMFALAGRFKVAKNYLSKIQFEITKNGKC